MGVVNVNRSKMAPGIPWALVLYTVGVLALGGYFILTAPKASPQPCICVCTPSSTPN